MDASAEADEAVASGCSQPTTPDAARIDPAEQIRFLQRQYLSTDRGFVFEGGAKIKLIIGPTGAGKTRFLADLATMARQEGFLTTHVDARTVQLGGFDQLYSALAARLDFAALARRVVGRVLAELGYGDPGLKPGETLSAWASVSGHDVGRLRVKLSEELHRRLPENPNMDYGYASGLLRWCDAIAWNAEEDAVGDADPAAAGGLLEYWLRGGRVAVRDCNRLRLRRSSDRFTARLWLRSLLHFIRMAGISGLFGAIDGLDVLVEPQVRHTGGASSADPGDARPATVQAWTAFAGGPGGGSVRYTKQRRDDLYECLRALIDDMGLMPGFFLALAGPPALVDPSNERTGFRSYPALAERVENDVETVELNRFADEIQLERLWAADPEAGRALADRLVSAIAPHADFGVRQRALAAARDQWAVRDVRVSAVRRSVLAVLNAMGADADSDRTALASGEGADLEEGYGDGQ